MAAEAALGADAVGDTINLGAVAFDLGDTNVILPTGVNLAMAPGGLLISQADLNLVGPTVVPGNNSVVTGVRVQNNASQTGDYIYQAAFGVHYSNEETHILHNPVPAYAEFRNCEIIESDSDGFYLFNDSTTACHIRCYNCKFKGKWDAFVMFQDTGTAADLVECYSCDSYAGYAVSAASGQGQWPVGIRARMNASGLRWYGGTIRADKWTGSPAPWSDGIHVDTWRSTAELSLYCVTLISDQTSGNSAAVRVPAANGMASVPVITMLGCAYDATRAYATIIDGGEADRASQLEVNHFLGSRVDNTGGIVTGIEDTTDGSVSVSTGFAIIDGRRVRVDGTGGTQYGNTYLIAAAGTYYLFVGVDGLFTWSSSSSPQTHKAIIAKVVNTTGTLTITDYRVCLPPGIVPNFATTTRLTTDWPATDARRGCLARVSGSSYVCNGVAGGWQPLGLGTFKAGVAAFSNSNTSIVTDAFVIAVSAVFLQNKDCTGTLSVAVDDINGGSFTVTSTATEVSGYFWYVIHN